MGVAPPTEVLKLEGVEAKAHSMALGRGRLLQLQAQVVQVREVVVRRRPGHNTGVRAACRLVGGAGSGPAQPPGSPGTNPEDQLPPTDWNGVPTRCRWGHACWGGTGRRLSSVHSPGPAHRQHRTGSLYGGRVRSVLPGPHPPQGSSHSLAQGTGLGSVHLVRTNGLRSQPGLGTGRF